MEHVSRAHGARPGGAGGGSVPADFVQRRLPYASGWYFLRSAASLASGEVRVERLCGRDLAVWRTAAGHARAAWNVCPHLGGRLGDNGRVEGETLECGLHRNRFATDGRGLERAAGRCLTMVPVREQHGVLLAWFDPSGAPPSWSVPTLDVAGWTPIRFESRDLATHPQYVMQDLADVEHFTTVHLYEDIAVGSPMTIVDECLSLGACIAWKVPAVALKIPLSFESRSHGLGYQVTEVVGLGGALRTRHFVLPTPLDRDTTRVHLGVSIRFDKALGRAAGAIGRLGRWSLERAFEAFAVSAFRRDVGRDSRLWVSRYHLDDALPAPDDDVARFREWARQFYPDAGA